MLMESNAEKSTIPVLIFKYFFHLKYAMSNRKNGLNITTQYCLDMINRTCTTRVFDIVCKTYKINKRERGKYKEIHPNGTGAGKKGGGMGGSKKGWGHL